MTDRSLYDVLRVPQDASPDQIERAWRELASFYHPDNFHGDDKKRRFAEQEIKAINHAHDILRDPAKRQRYDREFFGSHASGPSGNAGGQSSSTKPDTEASRGQRREREAESDNVSPEREAGFFSGKFGSKKKASGDPPQPTPPAEGVGKLVGSIALSWAIFVCCIIVLSFLESNGALTGIKPNSFLDGVIETAAIGAVSLVSIMSLKLINRNWNSKHLLVAGLIYGFTLWVPAMTGTESGADEVDRGKELVNYICSTLGILSFLIIPIFIVNFLHRTSQAKNQTVSRRYIAKSIGLSIIELGFLLLMLLASSFPYTPLLSIPLTLLLAYFYWKDIRPVIHR